VPKEQSSREEGSIGPVTKMNQLG